VKYRYEKERKPSCPNIRDKHGPVVVARLREVVQTTAFAGFFHLE
jgi:hypothetical protein